MYILYYNKNDNLEITKKNDVFDKIYYLEASLPTKKQIEKYLSKSDDSIKKFFKNRNVDDVINEIRINISQINNKVPLYDEYTKNMYIINPENVYNRVIYQYYRFPDKQMLELFKEKKKELKNKNKKSDDKEKNLGDYEKTSQIHYQKIAAQREYHKLELMIEFLEQFDLDILYKTYVEVFYDYANEVGKNITICLRPSFLPHLLHIKPYYTRSELINLALNMEIIKENNVYYNKEKVMELCNIIKKNDITSNTLTEHQEYIIKNDKIGIIQYYSLQGSYFMNQYMRQLVKYEYKNLFLEKQIESMWKLILNAPAFDKSYILYRFIRDDSYLEHLTIGDTFVDPGFISTTRDPFYNSEEYKFGFILLKIKIPAKKKGVGLCIETLSQFEREEEIILPPLSMLRLDRKDSSVPYYHTDDIYETKIKSRYEFTFVGSKPIKFVERPLYDSTNEVIDFLKITKPDVLTIGERIKYFVSNYTNPFHQFITKIGNTKYTIMMEWYDSTDVYKKFYAKRTNNGYLLYTIINDYIGFTIELGDSDGANYMYVNYYFRYSSVPTRGKIDDLDLINFLSRVSYYFEVQSPVIFAEYLSCDYNKKQESNKNIYYGGNYCIDFYNYFVSKHKKYDKLDSREIKGKFNYYDLDILKTTDPNTILVKDDRDELYQIYNKTYIELFEESKHNLADFYVWITNNYCVYLKFLIEKLYKLYQENNPFATDYYILDAMSYLYNRKLVDTYTLMDTEENSSVVFDSTYPKNEYRLNRDRSEQRG